MRKFKYTLDRKSLETIYIAFIRPILKYADVIWDKCTQKEKHDLEKIQLEAARIATGTTKLVSVQNLYNEIGWETLDERRRKNKLVLFYKMYNDIAPSYLSSLVPRPDQNTSRYSLGNANNIRTIHSRTSQCYNSFLPAVIRDWNDLPCPDRIIDTADDFKRQLNQGRVIVPKYFHTGNRSMQILHTRLRTGYSSLNYDLYSKNIIESPLCNCRCGDTENADHCFLPVCFSLYHLALFFSLFSLLILNLYLLIISQLSFTNKLLLLEEDYWKLTIHSGFTRILIFQTKVTFLGKELNKLLCFCSNPVVVFLYVLYM